MGLIPLEIEETLHKGGGGGDTTREKWHELQWNWFHLEIEEETLHEGGGGDTTMGLIPPGNG